MQRQRRRRPPWMLSRDTRCNHFIFSPLLSVLLPFSNQFIIFRLFFLAICSSIFFSKLSTDNFCPKRNKYNYSLFDASKNVRWLRFSVERVCLFVPLSTSVLFNVINFILIFNCENEQWIKVYAVNVWGSGGESGPQEVVLHIERMHIVFSVRSIISQSHWKSSK